MLWRPARLLLTDAAIRDASIQANFLVIYSTVKGEYPQTNVAVNTAFGLGASAPSGAGETFTK